MQSRLVADVQLLMAIAEFAHQLGNRIGYIGKLAETMATTAIAREIAAFL
jgi:hypothetical protein